MSMAHSQQDFFICYILHSTSNNTYLFYLSTIIMKPCMYGEVNAIY